MHIPPFLDFQFKDVWGKSNWSRTPARFSRRPNWAFRAVKNWNWTSWEISAPKSQISFSMGELAMLRTIARHAGAWLKYCSCLKHPWTEKSANGGSFRLSQTALICESLIILAYCAPLIPFNPFHPLHNIRCGLPCPLRRKTTFKISCDTELMSVLK